MDQNPSLPEQRKKQMIEALSRKDGNIGDYVNSNIGYIIAAAMAEKATGKSYEELMKEIIFEPMHLETCGFGTGEDIWGHIIKNGKWFPTRYEKNPATYPADGVYCSLPDYVKFLVQLFEENEKMILDKDTFKKLMTAYDGQGKKFAAGFEIEENEEGDKILTITGNLDMMYLKIRMNPKKGKAEIVSLNSKS